MNNVTFKISSNSNINLFYKNDGSKITHIGINNIEPVGYSRLYNHQWRQGKNELTVPANQIVTKQNDIENWVIQSLKTIQAYDSRINPNNISYKDAILILIKAGKVNPDKLVDFVKNQSLPDKNDNWFYNHESKYGTFFPKPEEIKTLNGGFKGWWKKVEDIGHFEQELKLSIKESQSTTETDTSDAETKPVDKTYKTGIARQWES